MTVSVPLRAVPAQKLTIVLGGQLCAITLRQKSNAMYLELYVNDALVIGGVICQNRNRIVRDAYLGFIGDLAFLDTHGNADPDYTGLGSRYLLLYLAVEDLT